MIDPRKSPVAMLPILNAVAGHMIAKAAPLRVINVEDTEQMISEACDVGSFDCDAMEERLHHEMPADAAGESFAWQTEWLANRHFQGFGGDLSVFLNTLECVISEAV